MYVLWRARDTREVSVSMLWTSTPHLIVFPPAAGGGNITHPPPGGGGVCGGGRAVEKKRRKQTAFGGCASLFLFLFSPGGDAPPDLKWHMHRW